MITFAKIAIFELNRNMPESGRSIAGLLPEHP
jgi:hypothetical protein